MALTLNLPKPVPVDTSIGTLYARHLGVGDLIALTEAGLDDMPDSRLGQLAIQRTTSKDPDSQDRPSLSDQEFNSLTEEDLRALTTELARLSGVVPSPEGAIVDSFGQVVRKAILEFAESTRKSTEAMQEHIRKSYAFLNDSTIGKLQEQMKALAKLNESSMVLGAYADKVARSAAPDYIKGLAAVAGVSSVPEIQTIRPAPRIPPQEETPVGKAAIESARNSREVAQKIDVLAGIVAGINQTLVSEVLPSWIEQVEQDQEAAQKSFKQAARGLSWTKWAVIVSVFVTVLVTWWQVSVAREIDAGNTAQMAKTEALLREQIELQKKLLESQELALAELKRSPAKRRPGDAMLQK